MIRSPSQNDISMPNSTGQPAASSRTTNADDALPRCPNCHGLESRIIYSVDGIPALSLLLMPDQQTATQYPRGDMRVSFCQQCGFLSNSAFDVTRNEYNPDYKETQHFSARFNLFADELIADLVDRFGIRNKRVLEIGCGKAEFLRRLCEAGNNEGIGVDPSVRPERLSTDARAKMQFISELYSEEHSQLHADVILCRHTLAHIQPTRDFLEVVRRSIGRTCRCVSNFPTFGSSLKKLGSGTSTMSTARTLVPARWLDCSEKQALMWSTFGEPTMIRICC
jgi:hypothetical protein